MAMQLDTDLLDIREAAELLRVSETSLRRWTNAGRLPCLRIGGRRERRFRRSDLLAFVGSGDARAAAPPRNHFCDLYTSDLDRSQAGAAFLRVGLESGALCLLGYLLTYLRQGLSIFRTQRSQGALFLTLLLAQMIANLSESRWFNTLSPEASE